MRPEGVARRLQAGCARPDGFESESAIVTELSAFANLHRELGEHRPIKPTPSGPVSMPLALPLYQEHNKRDVHPRSETETTSWEAGDERELVAQAKRDPKAFAVLYRIHYDAIAGYVLRRVGNVHSAEDLVAEVFLSAMRSLPRYRHRGVPIRAWFYRIATHSVNRWSRGRRRRGFLALPESLEATASVAARSTDDGFDPVAARAAMLKLSPKFQTVLALHYLEGLALAEVATVTGWRLGTVKSRLSRARVALRETLSTGR